MLRRLPKILLVIALTSSIGLHWAFLQSVAWLGMLVGDLQRTTFTQAVERTFDGKHPCSLCKAIAKSKKSDKKSEFPSAADKKFEFLTQTRIEPPAGPTEYSLLDMVDISACTLTQSPPKPPPRLIVL